jgi:hypothetical protein
MKKQTSVKVPLGFILSALVITAFLAGGCTDPLNESAGLQNGTTSEGLVKVQIAISPDQTSRSLSAGQVQSYTDWKEAIFKEHNSDPAVYYSGGSAFNETLYVEVRPGKSYDILVLVGTKDSHVLLGSDYVENRTISVNGDNTISISLKKILIDPYSHFKFTYEDHTNLTPAQDDKNNAYIPMLKSGDSNASNLGVSITIGNIKPLVDATTAFKLAKNNLTLFPTDIRNYSFDTVEKKSDADGQGIKDAVQDVDDAFNISFTAFNSAFSAFETALVTLAGNFSVGADQNAVNSAKSFITSIITSGTGYAALASTAITTVKTDSTNGIDVILNDVTAPSVTTAPLAKTASQRLASGGATRNLITTTTTGSNERFSDLKMEVEFAFGSVDAAFARPNVKAAGATFTAAKTAYTEAKSAYALVKTAYDKTALALADFDNAYNYVIDPTVGTDTLTAAYTIAKQSLPDKDVTGKLYFDMEYYAFSDPLTNKKWHIRNGLDFEPDEPNSTHGAILVKFGEGNPLPGVGVPVP